MDKRRFKKVLAVLLFTCLVGTRGQRTILRGAFNTEECRRCLDHFQNGYFCASDLNELGACCPFPEERVGITKVIDP